MLWQLWTRHSSLSLYTKMWYFLFPLEHLVRNLLFSPPSSVSVIHLDDYTQYISLECTPFPSYFWYFMENYLSDETIFSKCIFRQKGTEWIYRHCIKPTSWISSNKQIFTRSRHFLPYLQEDIKFSRTHNTSYGQQKGTPGSYFLMVKGQNNRPKTFWDIKVFTPEQGINFQYSLNVTTVRIIERF